MNKAVKPSQVYLDLVKKESRTLKEARKDILLILDLNGTLVSRNKRNKSMFVRPFSQQFFDYVFDNFTVMLWSSAQTHSVNYMSRIFGERKKKLGLIWDRHSFKLSERDYNRKVVTIKDLDKPYNAVHPTEFEHFSSAFVSSGESELLHVMSYLKTLQFQSNIANYIKKSPYQSKEAPNEKNTWLVEYYLFAGEGSTIVDLTPKDNKKKTNADDEVDAIITDLSNVKI
ncbi:unnamed protein product [Mucor hiemalis]